MSPDIGYFIFQTTDFRFGHTLLGILFFCVPISLAALWLFHSFLKYPLISLLPEAHRKHLLPVARRFRFGPLPHFAIIVLSIVVGALTHIVWDAVTHEGELGARNFAFLRRPIWNSAASDPLKLCDVLQHASTFLGAVLLVLWYFRWLRQQSLIDAERRAAQSSGTAQPNVYLSARARQQLLLTMAIATPVLAIMFNYSTKLLLHSSAHLAAFLRLTVLLGVPLLLLQLCLYSLIWHLIASRQFTYSGQASSEKAPGAKNSGAGTSGGTLDAQSTRESTGKVQPSSGEYAMRFVGDMQHQTAAMKRRLAQTHDPLGEQHPSGEERPSGEYSMRGPC
jgi:hypothetical protein